MANQIVDVNGHPIRLVDLGDGTFAVKTDSNINIDSVIATDVTIRDSTTSENKLKINTDGSVNTQLSGSKMEYYGASIDNRPDATTVPIGATFTIVDSTGNFDSWMSDGSNWLEV